MNMLVSFYEAINERELEKAKQQLYINALAASGDSKAIKKVMDQLDGKQPEMMNIEHYD